MCKKEIARVALRSRCKLFISFPITPPAMCVPAPRKWLDSSTGMPRDAGLRCAVLSLIDRLVASFLSSAYPQSAAARTRRRQ